ncbi:hypothetical protein C2G38_2151687 [Gigaspora rosea]|uniref:Uncharacterized protein n=1 Tax=Gigaspora rosea TaxID=44941 RepID=A0A397W7T3_9GLOM|nr:hypothetical protein C2G38_2151687 [Gigaspora rosea]
MSSGKKFDKSNLTISSAFEIQQMQTQTSYAGTFPLDGVPHGFYSSMMNILGNICGFIRSIQIAEIPRQAIMTKTLLYIGIYQATFGVTDVRKALIDQHIIGTQVLQDCIESCEAIAFEIKEIIDEPAHSWGVNVKNILICDIIFSSDLQKSLSSAINNKKELVKQIRYLEAIASMSKASGTKVIFMPYSPGQVQFETPMNQVLVILGVSVNISPLSYPN